jgi:phage shock protein PspC (stress-responsive transcriptional regulator)
MPDVEFVKQNMGNPSDFAPEHDATSGQEQTQIPPRQGRKQLFRDPDHRILAGVCAGLGHYFGLDPVWLRLAFVAIVLFGGSGVLIYLILWLVMPKARTTADKLNMKGEPVDLEGIKRMFNSKGDTGIKDVGQNLGNTFERFGRGILDILYLFLKAFGKVIGLFLLALAVLGLFGVMMSYFSLNMDEVSLSFNDAEINHLNQKDLSMWIFGQEETLKWVSGFYLILSGLPVMILMLIGLKLVFKSPAIKKNLLATLAAFWLFVVILTAAIAFYKSSDIRELADPAVNTPIQWPIDTLYISIDPAEKNAISPYNKQKDWYIDVNDIEAKLNAVEVSLAASKDDTLRIEVVKMARGSSYDKAAVRASNIDYNYRIEGNELILSPLIRIFKEDMYRMQQVEVKIWIPEGKVVYPDPSMRLILNNAPRKQRVKVDDMLGHYWRMIQHHLYSNDF